MVTFPQSDVFRYIPAGDSLRGQQEASARAGGRSAAAGAGTELTTEQQRQVERMRQIDRTVRQHEQMHVTVGGSLVTSGPNYAFETGPDGKRYAVSGEVGIDTSPGRTPEETVPKAQQIRRAALAPPDPSPQDRRVAATASAMEQQALQQLAQARQQGGGGAAGEGADAGSRVPAPDGAGAERAAQQAAAFYLAVAAQGGGAARSTSVSAYA